MQEAVQGNNFYRAAGRLLRRCGRGRGDRGQAVSNVKGGSRLDEGHKPEREPQVAGFGTSLAPAAEEPRV